MKIPNDDKLNDDSPMPFGKYKDDPMRDVPASYFHYLWTNGMSNERSSVANYIRENMEALQQETPDLIWD